jgi:hypothetical protein
MATCVLDGICAYMRSDNWAWPSQGLLGIATERSRSAVNRSVKRCPYIELEHKRRTATAEKETCFIGLQTSLQSFGGVRWCQAH